MRYCKSIHWSIALSRNYFIGLAVLLSAISLLILTPAWSQNWNQITSLPVNSIFTTPYFLNAEIGFVYESDGQSPPHLHRTTDGGVSWKVLTYFDNQNIFLRQIFFTDSNRGYAAASDGVYETKDQGNTWSKIYPYSLRFNSIYAFGNKVFAFAGLRSSPTLATWGPLIETSDDGKTWDTVIIKTTYSSIGFENLTTSYVFGNNDSIVYAESLDTSLNMSLVYSTDNGRNWSSNFLDNLSNNIPMGYFSFPHCTDILITSLPQNDVSNADNYFIIHSGDFCAHRNTLYVPVEIGAWIAGNNCVQYVCDAEGMQKGKNRNGVWRSEDRGMSWSYINGPDFTEIDDEDFHNLSVTGNGSVVYAGDVHLNLWKTTDGGDSTISDTSFPSGILLSHDLTPAATICDTSYIGIYFTNLSCNYTSLKAIKIDGLDSSEYTSWWLHHLACDGVPDTIQIKVFSIPAINTPCTVHLHFMNDEFLALDTSISFSLSPNAVATKIAFTSDIIPAQFICDTSRFILTYRNFSCSYADLQSFSITGLDSTEYSFFIIHHPVSDSVADSVIVKIFPFATGAKNYNVKVHFTNTQAQSIDTIFNFTLPPQAIPITTFSQQSVSLIGSSGDTIETLMTASSTKDSTGIQTALLTFNLNTDLLTPIVFIPVINVTADPVTYTNTQVFVTLHFAPGFKFNGISSLGKMRYVAYVTDTLETDIILVDATHTSGCLSTLADSSVTHFKLRGCGTQILSEFMEGKDSFDITGIIPNPANNTTQVRLLNKGKRLEYQLYDALGVLQKNGSTDGNIIQIDFSGIPSGHYYFRLDNGRGIPITKQIIIQH